MYVPITVRYSSGREERFEVEIHVSGTSEFRLKEFAKDPTLLLKTDTELIIIPAQSIERIALELPESEEKQIPLENIRKAKRL